MNPEQNTAFDIFVNHLAKGEIAVFGGHAPEAFGLPGLGTISEFCRAQSLEVVHIGMGCFSVREGIREVLSFFGGGAMYELDGVHYTPLRSESGDRGVVWLSAFRDYIARFHGVASATKVLARVEHDAEAGLIAGRW